MSTRTRRKENLEQEVEQPISVKEAFTDNVEASIYDKFSSIVEQYGSNLLLRVYSVKSDNRSLGFIDEIVGDEIELFIGSPEVYLRDRFGQGIFRIIVFSNANKKIISNLTISISSPKNINPASTPSPQINLDDISKARKEGRTEILEVANLMKTSQPQPQTNQTALDLTKVLEVLMTQNNQSREREERVLEKIRSDEIRLREKELLLIEKAYANSTDITAHVKPFLDSMGVYGRMLSTSIGMVERALDFKERFNAPQTEGSFVERLLIGLGEKFLDSNPNLLKGLSLPPNNPILTKPIVTKNISSENNQPTEKTSSQPEVTNPTHEANKPNQPTVEQIFFNCLYQKLEKGQALDDPGLSADELLSEIEFFEAKGIMSEAQIKIYFQYLSSENLIPHLESIMPNLGPYKPFLLKFQQEFKKLLEETNEEETQTTN